MGGYEEMIGQVRCHPAVDLQCSLNKSLTIMDLAAGNILADVTGAHDKMTTDIHKHKSLMTPPSLSVRKQSPDLNFISAEQLIHHNRILLLLGYINAVQTIKIGSQMVYLPDTARRCVTPADGR